MKRKLVFLIFILLALTTAVLCGCQKNGDDFFDTDYLNFDDFKSSPMLVGIIYLVTSTVAERSNQVKISQG